MNVVWTGAIGFVVALFARMVLPGARMLGILYSAVLGVVGAFAATAGSEALHWFAADEPEARIVAFFGALLLLLVVGLLKRLGE